MKYLLTVVLVVSFVGMGILGSAVFDHDMNSSQDTCVGFSIDKVVCPKSIVGMTLHHISVLQILTTSTVLAGSSWLLLLASLFLVSVSIFLFYKNLLLPKLEFLRKRLRDLILHSLQSKRRIISWLSLLELSPAL